MFARPVASPSAASEPGWSVSEMVRSFMAWCYA
jgi:hypothetical protein